MGRALGTLSEDETRELRVLEATAVRRGSSPDETFELAAAAGVLALDAETAPPLPPSLREKLYAQADAFDDRRASPRPRPIAAPATASGPSRRPPPFASTTGAGAQVIVVPSSTADRGGASRPSPWPYALAAAAGVALVAGALYGRSHRSAAEAAAQQLAVTEAEGVALTLRPEPSGPPAGEVRLTWSPAEQRGMVSFAALPSASAGERYQLWLEDGARAAGPVVPTHLVAAADGTHRFTAPVVVSDLRGAFVTVEPALGSVQPTGPIVVRARR